jgi:outer membrane protein TolC
MNRRLIRFLLVLAWLCAFMPGRAQAQDALTLRRTVELALRNDTRVIEAAAKQEASAREADLSGARFGPNFFTGTGALYTYGFPQTPGGALPSIFNLAFTQTVFDAPARGRQRAARQRVEVQELAAKRIRDTVIFEAASAYLELAAVRESLERVRHAADSAQAVVNLDIERMKEGRLLPLDVLQARLIAARVAESIVGLENRGSALEDRLRVLTGLRDGTPVHVALEDLPSLPDRSAPELSAVAAAASPELKAAQLEVRARDETLAGERGGYWPSVDLVGNYAVFSRFNNVDVFFNRFQRHNLNVGVEARVPIFSAQTGPAVALARSQVIEAQAAVNRQRGDIEVQVRRAAERLREAGARRDVAEIELAVAQETARLAEARMAEGRADRIDRERALVDEGRAWDGYFQAEWARKRAQLELRRMTGELGRLFP